MAATRKQCCGLCWAYSREKKGKKCETMNNTLGVVPVIDTLWSNMWFKLSDPIIAQCGQMAHVHSNFIKPQPLDFHTTRCGAKLMEQQMESKSPDMKQTHWKSLEGHSCVSFFTNMILNRDV